MQTADYHRAHSTAEALLREFEIDEPVVPVFEIAQRKGLDIVYFEPEGSLADVSGLFDASKRAIYLNNQDLPQRQLFTTAHELGHYLLEHPPEAYGVLPRFATTIDKTPMEQEANCFAANLLVPEEMLGRVMKKYHLTEWDIDYLAPIFGVSNDVIKYRLKRINGNKSIYR